MKIQDICSYAPKSDIKAGEAKENGEYAFFTSSADEDKKIDRYLYDGEGIIMGTGGNATLHYFCGRYSVSTDCLVLIPNKDFKSKYLYYFFLHNMRVLEAGFKGAGLKHTNKKYIGSIELKRIHSIAEQSKIIRNLSEIDDQITKGKRIIEILDELVKSRFVEMFGDVIRNDRGWSQYVFEDITESRLGKMLDAKKQTGEHAYPYLANFNVQWFKFSTDILNEMDFDEKDRNEFELREGDLLVCEGGEIGRCAIWHNEVQPCYFQKALHRVRCKREYLLPEYLA